MAISVLFVCTGNICRSAFAERYARTATADVTNFTSAGTNAVVGAPVDDRIAAEAKARGIDVTGFAARQLTADLLRSADLILTMETHHRTWILDDFPAAVKRTFTLGQAVQSLQAAPTDSDPLTYLAAHRQRPRERDNIADPYRRGAEAARLASNAISDALDILLPRLEGTSRRET